MGASRRSPRRIITPTGSDITDRDQTGRRRRRRRMAGERPFDFRRRDITRRRPEPREKEGLFVPDPEAKRERLRRRRERLMNERKEKNMRRRRRILAPINKRERPPGYCPDPNMTILMADGSYKKAGELVVGDLVKTYHEKDLEKASKKSLVLASGGAEKYSQIREQLESSYAKATLGEYEVEFVDIIKDVEKIKLTFEGSEIICSLSHKFYVNDSWKEAKELVAGDEVSGKKLISKENVENGDVVFITIKDAHTYICEGLLSHNKSRAKNPEEIRRRKEQEKASAGSGRRRMTKDEFTEIKSNLKNK